MIERIVETIWLETIIICTIISSVYWISLGLTFL